ncbi:hypothetical protein CYLTODRAFT_490989 [Cylindrobasidium torrendii FP15055 ss-10]|uniref:F-box domain-containing protein n=1 Tax=Cylindrobasidium torrendii FP15055 ss-10 TaxID=1314674 RepID=A0A0D7BA42_9AGAR|nr:hypothetical protein CYLTODRAFT_490989 [Cylindrobasidium torrendii FP15055 ss-10]
MNIPRLGPMSVASPSTAQSHINSLPNELLNTVFMFVLFDNPDSSDARPTLLQIGRGLPPQFVLMQVCKHWLDLCTSLNSAWTNIVINLLPVNLQRIPPPGSPTWNRFAVACKRVLKWSEPLLLSLQLENWPMNEDAVRGVSGMGLNEQVLTAEGYCYRILQLAISQCKRWKDFSLVGYRPSNPAVPWAQLMEVAHRIPMLESFALVHMQRKALRSLPQPDYTNLFLDAPRLSCATFGFHNPTLNLPWSLLKVVAIDSAGFESYRQFADYIHLVATRTTASTVSLINSMPMHILQDTEDIGLTLPTIENSHISTLDLLSYMVLPPLRLPNLTTLNFEVSHTSSADRCGVATIEKLLRDSDCHLLTLMIDQRMGRSGVHIMAHLLPYLDTLENFTFTGTAIDEFTVNRIAEQMFLLLADPIRLPKLLTLTVNIDNSQLARRDVNPFYCSFDSRLGKAVWEIVNRRMTEWPEVRLGRPEVILKSFHVNVVFQDAPVKASTSRELLASEEWYSIKAAGVDFKINPPVESDSADDQSRPGRFF